MEQPSELFRVSSIILDVKNMLKKVHGNEKKKKLPEALKSALGRCILHY